MDADSSQRGIPANGKDEPSQTTPTGVEIPIPKREDVLQDLRTIARPRARVAEGPDNQNDSSEAG